MLVFFVCSIISVFLVHQCVRSYRVYENTRTSIVRYLLCLRVFKALHHSSSI
ncbi:hypothetical protein Lalb_Chr03g0042781 [Lupinus albus]|uniref:Uncharacterized protein n=1 Tax=Lupinus albus TaxID=3870 RepID=A0A6A4QX27_LUPAL|nr:hypothetical protein Lalb_Chr03g0042781 [Lupinus albus]